MDAGTLSLTVRCNRLLGVIGQFQPCIRWRKSLGPMFPKENANCLRAAISPDVESLDYSCSKNWMNDLPTYAHKTESLNLRFRNLRRFF
jgi:hypothetical protein